MENLATKRECYRKQRWLRVRSGNVIEKKGTWGWSNLCGTTSRFQSEIPPLRSVLSKIPRGLSFPRKRESSSMWMDLDPRLRGGDNTGDFHLFGWDAAPSTLRVGMTMFANAFQHPLGTGRAMTSRQKARKCINSEFRIYTSYFRLSFACL